MLRHFQLLAPTQGILLVLERHADDPACGGRREEVGQYEVGLVPVEELGGVEGVTLHVPLPLPADS